MPRGAGAKSRTRILGEWDDYGMPTGLTAAGTPMPLYVSGTGVLGVDLLSEAIAVSIENVHIKTITGATPLMDDTDKLAVSAYGQTAASPAGRTSMLMTASGAQYVWLASALDALTDDIGIGLIAAVTPTLTGGALDVAPIASELHIGEIGASTIIVTATVTLTTGSPYATGHLAGTGGALAFPNAGRTAGNTGVVQSVVLTDYAKQDLAFDLVIFNENPGGTTFTDMAAFAVADADLAKIAGVVSLGAGAYIDFSDNSVAVDANAGIVYDLPAGTTTLRGALVIRAAGTYASTADISVHLGLLRD